MRQRVDQVARIWAIAAFVAWMFLIAAALGSTTNVAHAASAPGPGVDQPSLEQRRPTRQTTVDAVSTTVMCPSCDTTLDQSNSPAAEAMRVWIEEAVDAGWTKEEIREGLVTEYDGDESILATPRAHGVGLLAFIVPGLVVLAALLGGVVLMRRWRRDDGSGSDDQTRSGSSSYSQSSASPSASPNSSPSTDDAVAPSPSSSR
jgi:cytochrome c-type biogenesis protein CcmH/NrfF